MRADLDQRIARRDRLDSLGRILFVLALEILIVAVGFAAGVLSARRERLAPPDPLPAAIEPPSQG
jgi:hypothetical protein